MIDSFSDILMFALGVVALACVGFLYRQLGALRAKLRAATEKAAAPLDVPAYSQELVDLAERGVAEPSALGPDLPLRLPVVDAKCSTCKFWNREAGQRELLKNPTFSRVMQVMQPYQMGWVRDARHAAKTKEIADKGKDLRELETQLRKAKLNAAPDSGEVSGLELSIQQTEAELEALEAELKTLPEWEKGGLDDPKVAAMVGVSWEDFGVCIKRKLLVTNRDTCDDHTASAASPGATG